LQKRRIVEVTLKGTEKGRKSLVGFIGEAEGDYFDLAHSVNSNGEYDTWFRPSFIPEKYLLKPNDLLRLEEISSIAILRKFTPEPGFSDKGILDFP